ncbi:N-acyl-D-amino-acid deacylase family protein [Ktedonosporobacter rubrisoli]|uniref:N-acyl-D-amino-acid deacylase family protein n=1 Tax=Ktedonosporobacter rubrisoli TaxID=2509675 RepID=UPI0013EEB74C|nr:D-aminoacylase [Ktedonosporobacter rubrisoli]
MYDLLIQHARVVDGTGNPAFNGDVGIVGQRIVALGADLPVEAQRVIDAQGQVVAPGFIDAHTHDDLVMLRKSTLPPKVCQGVTTLVTGNCGFGMAPMVPAHMEAMKTYSAAILGKDDLPWEWPTLGSFLKTMSTTPLGQNVCTLLAHGPLRVAVLGFAKRAATEQEIQAQEALVAEAMQAGAAGMSLGLAYIPGAYTPTAELVRLAQVVGRYGGVLASHMRGEGDTCLSSINEMLNIAEQANVAVHISHLKITGRKNWGTVQKALDLIAEARARGLDVTIDVYPYSASSTTITQLLPSWVQEGGTLAMLERLKDPAIRQQVRQNYAEGIEGWENAIAANGWDRFYISSVQQEQFKALEGLNIAQVGEALGLSPADALFHLVLEEQGQVSVILFNMDERDVDQVVQAPFAMLGSDGLPILSGRPHPRLYGTFPRFFQRYVRELGSIGLEQAVYKATAFPASRFALKDRGVLAVDKVADLVIFDPATISDRATYDKPQVYPEGITAVIVAGQPVVLNGQLQEALPGLLLRPSAR